ncbi:MAG: flagellar export protein FliJ [Planctomycetota bacterium]
MPTFTFRYETLLQHRRNLEDQAQRVLAERVRTQMILTDQLRAMQNTITDSKRDLGSALVGRLDLSRVGEFTRFTADATVRGRQLVARLAELEPQIAAARAALLDATRQRQALELLRERDHDRWRREQDRRETAALDEASAQAYTRQLFAQQQARHRAASAAAAPGPAPRAASSDGLSRERVA